MPVRNKFHKLYIIFLLFIFVREKKAIHVMPRKALEKKTDGELLAAYRAEGDIVYFAEVYKRYMPLVFGVALKYLKDREEARDAVMQLFEELADKVRRGEDVTEFKGWLYVCTRNFCLMALRRKERNLTLSLDDSFMEFLDEWHLEDIGEDEEWEQTLRECLGRLPEKQRIAVERFFLEELSYREVEERTGFPMKAVKSSIQNGKRNLKLCLERKGIRG